MALPNTFLKVILPSEWPCRTHFWRFFCRPNDPAEHIFKGFFAVRMALPNTFLNVFFAVRMALPNTFLKVFLPSEWPYRTHFWRFVCRPNGPTEHIFEGFFAVRRLSEKIFQPLGLVISFAVIFRLKTKVPWVRYRGKTKKKLFCFSTGETKKTCSGRQNNFDFS